MCGVFCKRVWLLFTSFTVTNVYGAPGISSGSTAARGADGFEAVYENSDVTVFKVIE